MLIEFSNEDVAVLKVFQIPVEVGVVEVSAVVARDWLKEVSGRVPALPDIRPHWKDKLELAAMQSKVDTLRREVRDLRIKSDNLEKANLRLEKSETNLTGRNARLAERLEAMEAGYKPPQVVGDVEVNSTTLEKVVKMLGGITRSELAQEVQNAIDTRDSWDDYEEPGW